MLHYKPDLEGSKHYIFSDHPVWLTKNIKQTLCFTCLPFPVFLIEGQFEACMKSYRK